MRTLMRRDFKRLLFHSPKFREVFPEYGELYSKIDSGKVKRLCCGFPEALYQDCIKMVRGAPKKWKEFLNVESIQLYFDDDGRGRRAHIL